MPINRNSFQTRIKIMSNTNQPNRLFKTGATVITESPEMRDLSLEQVRQLLKASYPEIAHATVRETPLEDGILLIEFLAQAGRKG
jgi:PRTRC genetic system protein C